VGEQAIIDFHLKNPPEGYRRLTFTMLDGDVVAVSPASVWRLLKQAGRLTRWRTKPSRKGTGFEPPLQLHEHWHIDVSYINLCGTFLLLVLRAAWVQSFHRGLEPAGVDARGRHRSHFRTSQGEVPEAKPRMTSDNGPQFVARDFKEFIRISGMTHVRTLPYYPQIERKNRVLIADAQAPGAGLRRPLQRSL
jgi:putative transposase